MKEEEDVSGVKELLINLLFIESERKKDKERQTERHSMTHSCIVFDKRNYKHFFVEWEIFIPTYLERFKSSKLYEVWVINKINLKE